ncbi:hypothetical protein H0H87_007573 [Tephrocybe sp. NHM501043]|nr:hypothetical protein H0H87_007573 [Tephrocybe sp. NHM501043]
MLLYKGFACAVVLATALAHPMVYPPHQGKDLLTRGTSTKKSPVPAPKKAASPVMQYTGNGVVENARKANNAPGRVIPKVCKKVQDCSCPKTAKSTSCINGACQCDNPVVNLVADKFMESVKAIGNAPITKAMGHLMQGLADVKQVVSVIAGAVLGPEAKAALKVRVIWSFTVDIQTE